MRSWMRARVPRWRALGLVALLIVLFGLSLWLVPVWEVEPLRQRLRTMSTLSATDRVGLDQQVFVAETAARATLTFILAVGALLLGGAIAWWRFEVGRTGLTHQYFAAAIEQLASQRIDGSPRTETRIGAVYALERLATESPADYWPVMDVLTAYLRENAAWRGGSDGLLGPGAGAPGQAKPAAEVQAILTVLGRRPPGPPSTDGRRALDLSGTDLRGATLVQARFEGVLLQGAHLEGANLTGASLERANLRDAVLMGANLSGADLSSASLSRANLEGARLHRANLEAANLSNASLRSADLGEANLRAANLRDADLRAAELTQAMLEQAVLWRANLEDAVLSGARLAEAHLERAMLASAAGLSWKQLDQAFLDETTVLPLDPIVEPATPAAAEPAPEPPRRRVATPRRAAPPKEDVGELTPARAARRRSG